MVMVIIPPLEQLSHSSEGATVKTKDRQRKGRSLEHAGRRESVRKILGVGALAGSGYAAGKWVKPVVDAVALPAHAQTSGAFCSIIVECTGPIQYNVTVGGAISPPIPGVTVDLVVQFVNGGFVPSPESFGSPVTDSDGRYSVTNSYSAVWTQITITASLPAFPEAGETVCTLSYTDPGPHRSTSTYYFCSDASN